MWIQESQAGSYNYIQMSATVWKRPIKKLTTPWNNDSLPPLLAFEQETTNETETRF